MKIFYASVRIIESVMNADKEYLYMIPPELSGSVSPYRFVTVPFGRSNKQLLALAVSVTDQCEYDSVKAVISVPDHLAPVSEEQYKLAMFISNRCFCTFGVALKTVLSPFSPKKPKVLYEITGKPFKSSDEAESTVYAFINYYKSVAEDDIEEAFPLCKDRLKALTESGSVRKKVIYDVFKKEKTVKRVFLNVNEDEEKKYTDAVGMLTPKQSQCFGAVSEYPGITVRELCERAGVGLSVIAGLEKKGLIAIIEEKVDRVYGNDRYDEEAAEPGGILTLSEEQQKASDRLKEMLGDGKPHAALLYGVTGSGKTKVIISAVKEVLSKGKGAIVLTPEIGLSSQALYQFRKDFGDKVAVIHSMLSDGEKRDTYKRIEKGEISVVLGTRSAIFAPMKNVGLIAIDEEQELTYKSERSPKYHARDIARFRCAYHNALMILASATPSVESMFKSRTGIYELIELKNRYNGSELPDVSIVDLRSDERAASGKLLSSELCSRLVSTKEKGEQSILYIGRRGHNSHISCRSCGYVYSCPNCSVSLTYHAYCDGGVPRLICHYCGYSEKKPDKCASCGSEHIGYFGYGTQLLQDELESLLGKGRCLRMDADTTAQKHSHDEILRSFRNKEADVLFGTQMVAKGLDFPNVTLVGLVQTDSSLYMSDFRSSERTFSLITQLMGRSGRAEKKGGAVIQTFSPDHEVIKAGAVQDYEKFYEGEIKLRKAVLFPPYCDIAVFTVSSPVENDVINTVKLLDREIIRMMNDSKGVVAFIKFGPCKEGIYKLYGLFRQRIIIKYRDGTKSRAALRKVYSDFLSRLNGDIKLEMDINPAMV